MFPPLCKIIWRITPLIPWSGLWHVPLWCRKLFNQWAGYILRHLSLNEQRAKSSFLSPDSPPKLRASAVEHDVFWSWGLWHGKAKRGYVWFSVVSFSTKWESEVSLIRYHKRIVHSATWTMRHKAKKIPLGISQSAWKKRSINPEAWWRHNIEDNTGPQSSERRWT